MISSQQFFDQFRGQKFVSADGFIGTFIAVNLLSTRDAVEITFQCLDINYYWREIYDISFVKLNGGKDFIKRMQRNHYLFDTKLFRLIND